MNTIHKINIGFINDKSPVLDNIFSKFDASEFEVSFRSEKIEDGLSQLSGLKELPEVCVIDLDFYDKNVLIHLQKLKMQYPTIKLIAHSDIDSEKVVKPLLEMVFTGYLLIGSDIEDFRKAIHGVLNGKRYFSVGVAKIVQEYFTDY